MSPIPKSRIVFAPAGSGKTEQLSTRYIELLRAGVRPERILTLTFTEKAAAEMKARIFRRLSEQDPELHRRLRDNVLRLRISTIHAFCLALVKRFAPLLGLDPRIDVLTDPTQLWTTTKYDTLMEIATEGSNAPSADYQNLMQLVTRDRVQGWSQLSRLLDLLFARRSSIARARPATLDTGQLVKLASELKQDPLTKAKLGQSLNLFPEHFDLPTLSSVAAGLEARRRLFLTQEGTPLKRGTGEEKTWNATAARYRTLVNTAKMLAEFDTTMKLFLTRFLAAYDRAKRRAGQVDYADMEYLAFRLLHDHPEWQNVLLAFEEHTDHLLVDEFQDTSFLQWGIIDRLTEEWRSGDGVKTALGTCPTLFLVGDEKQSIYLFRDAKVEVFTAARDQLAAWLGPDRLERVELKDNYRSLQAIIDFTNVLFSRLMSQPGSSARWRTRYAPFSRARDNQTPGLVEILLDHPPSGTPDPPAAVVRSLDAANVARRIKNLVETGFQVFDRARIGLPCRSEPADARIEPDGSEAPRPATWGDIAILIRNRTHLRAFEQALGQTRIPFIVVGGTGFYAEPEVQYVHALLRFLVDPADDLALYATLRGPVFGIAERDLLLTTRIGNGPVLWDRLCDSVESTSSPPEPDSGFHIGQNSRKPDSGPGQLSRAVRSLNAWLNLAEREPLAPLLEQILTQQSAWQSFWEPQRSANIRKFLRIVDELQQAGNHPLHILDRIEKNTPQGESPGSEPKADVRTEGRNAVQVITVHSAKGLQFPIVVCPGLDEKLRTTTSGSPLVIEELSAEEVCASHIPDPMIRRENQLHQQYARKELEEEKRVFYVACTRARDALILTGIWPPPGPTPRVGSLDPLAERSVLRPRVDSTAVGTTGHLPLSRLTWLTSHLGLKSDDQGFALNPEMPGVCVRSARSLGPADDGRQVESTLFGSRDPIRAADANLRLPRLELGTAPLRARRPALQLLPMARTLPSELKTHGKDLVGLGEVIHRILEAISTGALDAEPQPIQAEAQRQLRLEGLPRTREMEYVATVLAQIQGLKQSEAWDIVRPRPDGCAELPVMLNEEGTLYSGRIDRMIVSGDEVNVYDYKTFKVKDSEIPRQAREYHNRQLALYARAAAELHPGKKVSTSLIFTALPRIVPT